MSEFKGRGMSRCLQAENIALAEDEHLHNLRADMQELEKPVQLRGLTKHFVAIDVCAYQTVPENCKG